MTTSKIQRHCKRTCGDGNSKSRMAACRRYTPCVEVREMQAELREKLEQKRAKA